MKLTFRTTLDVPGQMVWESTRHVSFVVAVSEPLLRMVQVEGPCQWQQGVQYVFELSALGFLPLGRHHVSLVSLDPKVRSFETQEKSGLVRHWQHRRRILGMGQNSCVLEDRLQIQAGLLTPILMPVIWLLYRWRHFCSRRYFRLLSAKYLVHSVRSHS